MAVQGLSSNETYSNYNQQRNKNLWKKVAIGGAVVLGAIGVGYALYKGVNLFRNGTGTAANGDSFKSLVSLEEEKLINSELMKRDIFINSLSQNKYASDGRELTTVNFLVGKHGVNGAWRQVSLTEAEHVLDNTAFTDFGYTHKWVLDNVNAFEKSGQTMQQYLQGKDENVRNLLTNLQSSGFKFNAIA